MTRNVAHSVQHMKMGLKYNVLVKDIIHDGW
jgi:hypothetical protein